MAAHGQGQHHNKGAPDSQLALDLDPTAMRLGDRSADPQSSASVRDTGCGIAAKSTSVANKIARYRTVRRTRTLRAPVIRASSKAATDGSACGTADKHARAPLKRPAIIRFDDV